MPGIYPQDSVAAPPFKWDNQNYKHHQTEKLPPSQEPPV